MTFVDGCSGVGDSTGAKCQSLTCGKDALKVSDTSCAIPGSYTVIGTVSSPCPQTFCTKQGDGALFFGSTGGGFCAVPYTEDKMPSSFTPTTNA